MADNFDIWLTSIFAISGLIYFIMIKRKLIRSNASSREHRLIIGIIMVLVIWVYSLVFE